MPIRFDLSAFLSRHRSAKFTLALLIAVVVIIPMIFTTRAWRNKSAAAMRDGTTAQSPPIAEPLGLLLITIRPTGFDPQEIIQTEGEVLLSVDNRSGLETVDLQLEAEQGNRLHTKRMAREQLEWREIVYLNPGVYLLKETSHPEWVCRIQITSK